MSYRLKETVESLSEYNPYFVNAVQQFYDHMREQQYEKTGSRLPADGMLSFDEKGALGKCVREMDSLLRPPFSKNIHVFNIDSSKSLKETIYSAFIQGKLSSSECQR